MADVFSNITGPSSDKLQIGKTSLNKWTIDATTPEYLKFIDRFGTSKLEIIRSSDLIYTGSASIQTSSVLATKPGGATFQPKYQLTKASIAADGHNLGQILVTGHDGTGFIDTAEIFFKTDGAVSTGNLPSTIQIKTKANTKTLSTKLEISPNGLITIGDGVELAHLKLKSTSTTKTHFIHSLNDFSKWGVNTAWNGTGFDLDDNSKASWYTITDTVGDLWQINRAPAGSTTYTNLISVNDKGFLALGAANSSRIFYINRDSSAIAGSTHAMHYSGTLSATANNDELVGLHLEPTFGVGAFTGVKTIAIKSDAGDSFFKEGNFEISKTSGDTLLEIKSPSKTTVKLTDTSGKSFELISDASDFVVRDSNLAQNRFVIDNDGRVAIGPNVSNAHLTILSNTTTRAQQRFLSSVGTNVTTPNPGDTWFNGTNLYFHDGSINRDLLSNIYYSDGSLTGNRAVALAGNTLAFTGGSVGVGVSSFDSSAVLQVDSTAKGLLPPRMTTAQKNAITSPATGLTVYDTDTNSLETNVGTPGAPNWKAAGSGSTVVTTMDMAKGSVSSATIPYAVTTLMPLVTLEFDNNSIFASNKFTIKKTGRYTLRAGYNDQTQFCYLITGSFYKNNSVLKSYKLSHAESTTSEEVSGGTFSETFDLVAGDIVDFRLTQLNQGSLSVDFSDLFMEVIQVPTEVVNILPTENFNDTLDMAKGTTSSTVIPFNTITLVPLGVSEFDNNSLLSSNQFTVKKNGKYTLRAGYNDQSIFCSSVSIYFYKNGLLLKTYRVNQSETSASEAVSGGTVSETFDLLVNDVIDFRIYHTNEISSSCTFFSLFMEVIQTPTYVYIPANDIKANTLLLGGTTIDGSASLQIDSTTKGLLPPRMTTAQKTAISNPATGLTVYDTDNGSLEINNGTPGTPNWQSIGAGSSVTTTMDMVRVTGINTIPHNTFQIASFIGTTEYDTNSMVTNGSTITIKKSGRYKILATMQSGVEVTHSILGLYKNGGFAGINNDNLITGGNTHRVDNLLEGTIDLAANDYLQLQAYQYNGSFSSLNITFTLEVIQVPTEVINILPTNTQASVSLHHAAVYRNTTSQITINNSSWTALYSLMSIFPLSTNTAVDDPNGLISGNNFVIQQDGHYKITISTGITYGDAYSIAVGINGTEYRRMWNDPSPTNDGQAGIHPTFDLGNLTAGQLVDVRVVAHFTQTAAIGGYSIVLEQLPTTLILPAGNIDVQQVKTDLLTHDTVTDPGSPVAGNSWYNGTNLNFRHGSTTIDLLKTVETIWTGDQIWGTSDTSGSGISINTGIDMDSYSLIGFGIGSDGVADHKIHWVNYSLYSINNIIWLETIDGISAASGSISWDGGGVRKVNNTTIELLSGVAWSLNNGTSTGPGASSDLQLIRIYGIR